MTPVNHSQNKKLESYYEIELPAAPLNLTIDSYLHHIWNLHQNAAFYREMLTLFLSLWLTIGFRIVKLLLIILSRRKEKLSTKIAYLFGSKPPTLWTYYKRRRHGVHSKKNEEYSREWILHRYSTSMIK